MDSSNLVGEFSFVFAHSTGDWGAKLRGASLPFGRQLAGPFFGFGSFGPAALPTPIAGLRLPLDGQQVASVPAHRRRAPRLLHGLQRDSGSDQGQYIYYLFERISIAECVGRRRVR